MNEPVHPIRVNVGTAGWALPAAERNHFGPGVSNLARYATRFNCVEINSTFYRRHRPATWQRWADCVPDNFRFSVKLPKAITHLRRLAACEDLIEEFVTDTRGLGAKFAVALVQLAPKHAFDQALAQDFFATLRSQLSARIVCEPRHPSWFNEDANQILIDSGVGRVAADPAIVTCASSPGGSPGIRYRRLHGSPVIYRSPYDSAAIYRLAAAIKTDVSAADIWCIFDNTASSAATRNALDLAAALSTQQEH